MKFTVLRGRKSSKTDVDLQKYSRCFQPQKDWSLLTHPSEEGDVEERRVRIDELECEQLEDQRVVVLSLRPVVLCMKKKQNPHKRETQRHNKGAQESAKV